MEFSEVCVLEHVHIFYHFNPYCKNVQIYVFLRKQLSAFIDLREIH
jgi:hypothetical protein